MKRFSQRVQRFFCIGLIFGIVGCSEKLPKPDPSVDAQQQSQVSMFLMMSPETKNFAPMQIIVSENEADHWIATVISQKDPSKKAKFKIDKKNKAVKRLDP